MDFNYLIKMFNILISGLGISVKLFFLTLLFAIPMGMFITIIRKNNNQIINFIIKIYILIMRGTPLLLQIIVIYFIPYYIFGLTSNRFIAAIIAFSLNYAAYFSEIFRAGLNSINIGQWEAAKVLGFTKKQTFFKIILPQVFKNIIPPMTNDLVTLIRDTSLAQVIGITELFSLAQKQASFSFSLVPLILAGLIYLVICLIITVFFHYIEKKLSYYR